MLHAQIERALEVNGALFNALAVAGEMPDVATAEKFLREKFARSQIYRVKYENPETVAVMSVSLGRAVARVGVE